MIDPNIPIDRQDVADVDIDDDEMEELVEESDNGEI